MSTTENTTELAQALNRVHNWFERFIVVPDPGDLDTLALWCAHTWALECTATTPRIQIDSTMPGSGKTTALEHIGALSKAPVQAASIGSPAVITRMLAVSIRTILIDEVDRSLNPKNEGVGELIAIINAGYKRGATRPVSVKTDGDWTVKELPTFAPVVMAGNAPQLPDDTRSRCIRILLMPDLQGKAEDSDWEEIEPDSIALKEGLQATVEASLDAIKVKPVLPDGCRGRMAEKWRPLARIAHAAGGHWVDRVNEAIKKDLYETEMEREDGMSTERPAVVLLRHIHEVWEESEPFITSSVLIGRLVDAHPNQWGELSTYGKKLTAQRLGRMLSQGYKIHSSKHNDVRGYRRGHFQTAFRQFGLVTVETAETVRTVLTGDKIDSSDGLDSSDSLDSMVNAVSGKCLARSCNQQRYGQQSYCYHHFTSGLGEVAA